LKRIYVTPDDAQIDLLLKRHARRAMLPDTSSHLDEDELNAFAEGALPAATRARFVSHFADCDDCRRLVTQLSMASGVASQVTTAEQSKGEAFSFSKKLKSFLAPARLRYAAFALVLIAAATVTFIALRERGTRQFAEPAASSSGTETAKAEQYQRAEPPSDQNRKAIAKSAPAVPQVTPGLNAALKPREPAISQKSESVTTNPATQTVTNSRDAQANRAAEPQVAEAVPSFAPPPPGEAERTQQNQNQNRETQTVGGVAGRAKDESPNARFGALAGARTSERQRSPGGTLRTESAANKPADILRPAADDKSVAKAKETDTASVTSSNANEVRAGRATPKQAAKKAAPARADAEELPSERKVGGRKFRREGNAWIDTKFKASMTVKSISRGSDEYRELDSSIRSVVEQLGGDVLIVSKGKAYRIH
jgi:Putative zinc-finger